MHTVRSPFDGETRLIVPVDERGTARRLPGDRGNVILDGFTREDWAPDGPRVIMAARELASRVPTHSTLRIDTLPELSVAWTRTRGPEQDDDFFLDSTEQEELTIDELAHADLREVPSALPLRPRDAVARIVRTARADFALVRSGHAGRSRTAWLAVAPDWADSLQLAGRIEEALGATPHPVVLVAAGQELPRGLRHQIVAMRARFPSESPIGHC